MNDPTLSCKTEWRHKAVRRRGLNGLDFLEVEFDEDTKTCELLVYFINQAPDPEHVPRLWLEGGRRIPAEEIPVLSVDVCPEWDPERDRCMRVSLGGCGDLSPYRLCVADDAFNHFDPRYACLAFTFGARCPSDLDCKVEEVCPPPERPQPQINTLAKDYASFRQLILDRLALLMPAWRERHVPDLGITLVELLAYEGDHLSYYQDAVATEAYLDTARQRISVRRHARLVDYILHEGCNARAWVFVEVTGTLSKVIKPSDVYFTTRFADDLPRDVALRAGDLPAEASYEVFKPLVEDPQASFRWREAHNEIHLYTWGDHECCLPRGATQATLVDGSSHYEGAGPPPLQQQKQSGPKPGKPGDRPPGKRTIVYERVLDLRPGDYLLFEEVLGPGTGDARDADPAHRHVVRLTRVEQTVDGLCDPPLPLLEIAWAQADALPFPLCLSAIIPALECEYVENISVARGNIVLVDHGRTWEEPLDGRVPARPSALLCEGPGEPAESVVRPGPFRPKLKQVPLTFAQPLAPGAPAAGLLKQDPHRALPHVRLWSEPPPDGVHPWKPRADLLASKAEDPHFVVEMDGEGVAHLRFGDGELGKQPAAGTTFKAEYRVGNGPAGNVGAGAIAHIVLTDRAWQDTRLTPTNPLPAQGGKPREPLAEAKLLAPTAFRQDLQRAITAGDYARLVERDFAQVQRAAAQLRWTGSWYEVVVAVDQRGRPEADPALLREIRRHLWRYRRIGHDLRVVSAQQVPLHVKLVVCVLPDYLRGHVKAALLQLFGNRQLPDGRLGFFHPDNLTFGEGIALSRLVALVRSVPGVENVAVERLERYGRPSTRAIIDGVLQLGPLEVARLDNDPNQRENGRFELEMRGGR
jgi:hypothetical protein